MAKSKSSKGWLKEHFDDEYVRRSQQDGYRSRAIYKLIEIDKKDRLIKPGMTIIDLGAAPGGWSQYASRKIGARGKIVATDILPIAALPDVTFIQGDFTEQEVYDQIIRQLDNEQCDLVMSDMAPNMSGMKAVDQPKSMYLVELAMDLAAQVLAKDGAFLTKVFQGEGYDGLLKQMREQFVSVQSRKPDASRSRSREIYLLCKGTR